MKPGIKTSEFWTTVATDVALVVTLVFHKDFSGSVPAVALAASAVVKAGYSISRGLAKSKK